MAKTTSLALDANGDLDRVGGAFLHATGKRYLVAKVRSRLLFFLGEWFLDQTRVGVPYHQRILGAKGAELPRVRALFLKELLGTQGIATVEVLTVELAKRSRSLTVSWRATGDLGQLLSDKFEGPLP